MAHSREIELCTRFLSILLILVSSSSSIFSWKILKENKDKKDAEFNERFKHSESHSASIHSCLLLATSLARIGTDDLARYLTSEVFTLLGSSKALVRKKSIGVVLRVFDKYHDAVKVCFKRLVENLESSDAQLLSAVVGVCLGAVIEAIKSKGITAIGVAGMCWGAKMVVELSKQELVQAAVLLHPSFVTVDDIKGGKVPIAILGAEIDQLSPPAILKQFEEILASKPEDTISGHFSKGLPNGVGESRVYGLEIILIVSYSLSTDDKSYGVASPATPTSSKTSSSPPTANSRFPEAGKASFAFGISPPASRLADSSDTPKMSSPWPSRSTTVRSSRPHVTARSSSGTLWGSPTIVSVSWDKTVKVWNLSNCKLRSTLAGHTGYASIVAVSPDGSLCASGGKSVVEDLKVDLKADLESKSVVEDLKVDLKDEAENGGKSVVEELKVDLKADLESKSVVEDLKVDLKAEAEKSDGSGTAATKRKGTVARG
ncbi:hypothetical protein DY000_02042614 [Brassica cretica]|uniref:Uncharacterized protein n=1 Tax=Brassica cretica TaxID=69181 RepID=A0ABQ7BBU2_BRACR|nr:hypothetical protein DY000_02042614 [Brassica cretica]